MRDITVFIERKIAGRMKGEQFRHFEVKGGWADLVYQVSKSPHCYFTSTSVYFHPLQSFPGYPHLACILAPTKHLLHVAWV